MKYTNPPVVETVLSVQFGPLPNFGAVHLGSYCNALGPEWTWFSDAPALDPVHERFESAIAWGPPAFGFKVSKQVELRAQIRNSAKDRMIQVQNGRFLYNWLRTPDKDYPSYESVRPEFDEHWEKFREFVISQDDNQVVQPNLWEVVYVNHIPQGTVWTELSDLPNVLSFLGRTSLDDLSLGLQAISGEWQFEIAPMRGRLYVKSGMNQKDDGTPNVVLTLIARGPITSDGMSLDEGLELGHQTVIDAFDKVTTSQAQASWGISHGNSR